MLGEQWNDRVKLIDGARPAVREDQGNGIDAAGSRHMIEVNVEVFDSRGKLRVAV